MKYIVTIGGRDLEVRLDGDALTIDGTTVPVRLEELPASPVKFVTVGREVYRVLARRGEHRGQYDLWVAGHRFAVEALDERARAIRELAGKTSIAQGPAQLRAPMPGLIVRVHVAPGDQVRAGQGLVVVEAMKMENELRAAADGIVKSVAVKPGVAVEKGALLVEMEGDAS